LTTPEQSRRSPISVALSPRAARSQAPVHPAHTLRVVRWISGWLWWEGVGISVLLVVALFLRAHHLTSLPAGIHGDEAIFGTEGYVVLHQGLVGSYSFIAAGQPTGPFYLDALAVALFGRTVFAVRVVSMLVGALTIPALYLVLRRNTDRLTAFVGAAILAVMNWHLHFARVGFALALWLFGVVLITGALTEAIRRRSWRWWAATGTLAGLSIYAYNAHTVFLAILMLFIAAYFARALITRALPPRIGARCIAAVAITLGITTYPMASFVLHDREHYLAHLSFWSIFTRQEWQSRTDTQERVAFLAARYLQYWNHMSFHPQFDGADATSIVPTVPPALLVLALSGIVLALFRHRTPLVAFGLCVILLMPFASILTVDGLSRRTFASAAFVAVFAALPFVEAIKFGWAQGTLYGKAIGAGLSGVIFLLVSYQGLHAYFGTFADSPQQAYVFTNEMTDAARFMATLPTDSYVYFYSDRWSVKYETRQFLAPNIRAEDRSAEFGHLGFDVDPTKGKPVFVFLGKYRPMYDAARERYPQGTLLLGSAAGRPTFVAYVVGTGP